MDHLVGRVVAAVDDLALRERVLRDAQVTRQLLLAKLRAELVIGGRRGHDVRFPVLVARARTSRRACRRARRFRRRSRSSRRSRRSTRAAPGSRSAPSIKIGPRIVIATNHFVRTRSSNSRFAITQVSRIIRVLSRRRRPRPRRPSPRRSDAASARRPRSGARRSARRRARRAACGGATPSASRTSQSATSPRARRSRLGDERAIGEHRIGAVLRGVVGERERDEALGGGRALDVAAGCRRAPSCRAR